MVGFDSFLLALLLVLFNVHKKSQYPLDRVLVFGEGVVEELLENEFCLKGLCWVDLP